MSGDRVLIIAEAGSNWRMGSPSKDLAMAKTLIELAAEAGADAVKFQVFRAQTVYAQEAGPCAHLKEKGIHEDIQEVFKDLEMPYEMIPKLAEYCRRCGVSLMASFFSPHDFWAVDPHVSMHKIASPEMHHPRLLELAARSGKQTLISTGISQPEEIAWALKHFLQEGGRQPTLMQCTVQYPADPDAMNLRVIPFLRERFGVPVGLSDHSRDPVCSPVAAVALGARVIEKHFTLDNRLVGPDHVWAITPQELKEMVRAVRLTEQMLGSSEKEIADAEKPLLEFSRRGIQAIRPIKRGELFQEGVNIDILRPGKHQRGVHPRHLELIEGKPAQRDVALGTGIQEGDWEN